MKLHLKSILVVLLSQLFWLPSVKSQEMIPDDFCINDKELHLYNLINNFRNEHNLAAIPLSKNLSYVARLHVNDLHHNRPDTANCNLHSWSDKGVWAECCYGREQFNSTCMTSKPRELTNYNGKGYEIAFWENLDAVPEIVLDLWINSSASREMIINADIWQDKPWKALGVGIHKGYAVAWFGDEDDPEKGVRICDSVQPAEQLLERVVPVRKTPEGVRYYLIIASFKERSLADKEVAQLRTRGFRTPSVVVSGENYRVSLGTYETREEALKAKGTLNKQYQKAWLLKQ